MPQLTRVVRSTDPPPLNQLRDLYEAFAAGRRLAAKVRTRFEVRRQDDVWEFERAEDFFHEVASGPCDGRLREEHGESFLDVAWSAAAPDLTITLRRPDAGDVAQLMARLGDIGAHVVRPLRVFLGHGRDHQWRALRDHLVGHPDVEILTYESHALAGDPATIVLERLAEDADAAVVLFTAELRADEGWRYAVPNVIHETGLFQGRLGWGRTLIVREDSCSTFANTAGLTEVRFPDGHVREAFGDVVSFLRRTSRRTAS